MEPREEVFVLGIVLCVAILFISVLIGVWSRRFTHSLGDYYVAGRSIGALNNGLAMVSIALTTATFIGLTALIIEGLYIAVAVYAAFTASFIGLLILAAPYLRRQKSFTSMAFISQRYYSKNLRIFSVIVMLVISYLYLAANLKAIGIIFYYLLGVPEILGILVGGLIVIVYVVLGGMYGATYNQTFQSIVLMICLLIPVAVILRNLGASGWFFPPLGYGEMVPLMEELVPHYFWPMVVHPGVYISIFLGCFFGIIGLPHFVMRFFTVRDAKEARWSTVICVFLVGLINTSVYATGFAAVYYMTIEGLDVPAAAYDYMVFILTESLGGETLLALIITGSIAAALSTLAGILMIVGAGLVHDLYATIKPDIDDHKKLKMSYWAMFLGGLVFIVLSINPPEFILKAIMWAVGIAGASLGVPIVLGIWWKRTTKEGAAAGMITGFILVLACWLLIDLMGIPPTEIPIPFMAKYLYGPLGFMKAIGFVIPLCFIITIVVSWFTKEPPLEVKQSIDEMHGWSEYNEKRYNGLGLPITIIIIAVFSIYFLTTLYDTFSAIPG